MVLVLLTVGFAVPLDVADVNDWLLLLMFSVMFMGAHCWLFMLIAVVHDRVILAFMGSTWLVVADDVVAHYWLFVVICWAFIVGCSRSLSFRYWGA